MKIKYEFADETIEIEVSEDWGAVLIELDRQEYNNDHAETRRHCSLDQLTADGNDWIAGGCDVEGALLGSEDQKQLASAIAMFIFVIIMLVTVIQMKLQKKWVNYD